MNKSIKHFFPMLTAGLTLIAAARGKAQNFTTLHSFTEGAYVSSGKYTNSDGAKPIGTLVLSGNILCGTAQQGGSSGDGTVFAVNTDGTGFATLHTFIYASDGSLPRAGLILSRNTLYGAAQFAGSGGAGTVFKVNTHGRGFTTLHEFTAFSEPATNSDGAYPVGELILSGNTLYGTTLGGGISDRGTVFKVNTHGRGFMTLHTFTARDIYSPTNSDGAFPWAGLILSDNTLYGTARGGGNSDSGTVFALNTDGTGFATLHSFTENSGLNPPFTNSDGAGPIAGVILSGNVLYGTTYGGGNSGNGTVFALNTDGTAFTTLYSFTVRPFGSVNSDGAYPNGLILSGNTLYGTTYAGGDSGNGTVFSISLPGP